VEGLGLDNAAVQYDQRRGVTVNDYLQTSAPHIFAVGDACQPYRFTHVSDFTARLVIRNALFFGKERFSSLIIPWCTYTDPEIAHVGLYPHDCAKKGIPIDTYTRKFEHNDRSICEAKTAGFVKIHTKQGTDKILGATIVGQGAGDMISEITLAMHRNIGLGAIATVIHPYPTHADAIRSCGDDFNKTKLTAFAKSFLRGLITMTK